MRTGKSLLLAIVALLACGIVYAAQENKTQPSSGQQAKQNPTPSAEVQRTAGNLQSKKLGVKLTQIGQENCEGQSPSEGAVIRLRLRLEATNLTDTKLILSKAIGAAFYGIVLAEDERALADGRYARFDIHWMWKESPLPSPPSEVPPAVFAILDPGQSFVVERTVYLPVHPAWLRPEEKVLQLTLGTWFNTLAPELLKARWRKYGELVHLPVKTDLMSLHIPLDADFSKCKP